MKRLILLPLRATAHFLNLTSHREKWISGLGGAIRIALTLYLSLWLPGQHAVLIVASMGASAVLLFAVPHSAFSTPWAVIGGYAVSALVGVVCAALIPDTLIATVAAIGLAIIAMHYFRCIHPPGGATAFFAAMGGHQIQSLGLDYVLSPVLFNAVILVAVALLFNTQFRTRQAEHIAEVESHLHLPEK